MQQRSCVTVFSESDDNSWLSSSEKHHLEISCPCRASHTSGAWERVVRSICKIFRALLGQQRFYDEMLQTFMAEVSGILNSIPLTPVSSDPKQLEPLTPNHLLLLRANPSLPVGSFGQEDSHNHSNRRCKKLYKLSTCPTYSGRAGYYSTCQRSKKEQSGWSLVVAWQSEI